MEKISLASLCKKIEKLENKVISLEDKYAEEKEKSKLYKFKYE